MSLVTPKGPRRHWKTLISIAGAAIVEGTVTVINSVITFAADTLASGDTGAFIYAATDVEVVKAAPLVITEGDLAYYDSANDNFTNVSTGNTLCGRWTAAAASADTVGYIDLSN